jgi:hypothetical protein
MPMSAAMRRISSSVGVSFGIVVLPMKWSVGCVRRSRAMLPAAPA